jgi:hypothetical protein
MALNLLCNDPWQPRKRRLKPETEGADTMNVATNRKSATIWLCAGIFCLSLFVAVIPIANTDSYLEYGISPKVIATLLLGWTLIISVCAFLAKCKGRRRLH